jgi:signal transduction histidine kinase
LEIFMDYFAFLKNVFFFKNLTEEEIKVVLAVCHEEVFSPGDILFEEGAMADRFYIVLDGQVEVWKNYMDPKPDLLGIHGPGHFFGEMALVDELPRSATVTAKDPTKVLFLFRKDFHELIRKHSSIALSVMMSMSFLVRTSNEAFVEDLRRRNDELEAAYSELEEIQTDRLRNERLSTLGKFSSMILHDIRNPISIIKGQAQLMLLNLQDEKRLRRSIQAIATETAKLERLASEFLDYSRGEIRLDFSIVHPRSLMSKVEETVRQRLESEGVSLEIMCETAGPVLVDEDRILRAILNIADNARKALVEAEKKQLIIHASDEDGQLVIKIQDSGKGMGPEILARIYEPFYSASGHGGTGLGLLIVKNIIEAHGGNLSVESVEGKGSTFTIRIPKRS